MVKASLDGEPGVLVAIGYQLDYTSALFERRSIYTPSCLG